eukprot:1635984-Amphidinium_carterae.1
MERKREESLQKSVLRGDDTKTQHERKTQRIDARGASARRSRMQALPWVDVNNPKALCFFDNNPIVQIVLAFQALDTVARVAGTPRTGESERGQSEPYSVTALEL